MLTRARINADRKIDKRFTKLDATIQETKNSFDTYIDENNKTLEAVKLDVKTVFTDLTTMKSDIESLKKDLLKAKQDLDKTRNKLDIAQKDLNEKKKH